MFMTLYVPFHSDVQSYKTYAIHLYCPTEIPIKPPHIHTISSHLVPIIKEADNSSATTISKNLPAAWLHFEEAGPHFPRDISVSSGGKESTHELAACSYGVTAVHCRGARLIWPRMRSHKNLFEMFLTSFQHFILQWNMTLYPAISNTTVENHNNSGC